MKKAAFIFIILSCTALLTACGDDTESSSRRTKAKDSSSVSSVDSMEEQTDIKMIDVNKWATGDIWNDGFCDIYHYIESGTNAVGDEMDIDFTVSSLKLAMEKKDEYNSFIHSLDDSVPEQAQLINAWDKMIEQTDILYQKVISETPRPSDETYEFSTDLFKQYFDSFYKLSLDIEEYKFK